MPTIGSRRSTSPTGFRGLVPAPDRPGTYASARPRHDHDLTTETAPRILEAPHRRPAGHGLLGSAHSANRATEAGQDHRPPVGGVLRQRRGPASPRHRATLRDPRESDTLGRGP